MNKLTVEIEVPDWVNWIAVDKSGRVDGYQDKPKAGDSWWYSYCGKSSELYQQKPPKNWKDELYTWR